CVTGLPTHYVGECFQQSPDTITRYFKQMLLFFSDNPFYSSQVKFPTAHSPVPPSILNNHCFCHFHWCIGTVNGTHIHVFASLVDHAYMCNRK
ncbi:hypothetical protein CY34DRAFT_45698, partial [Suillus luteus UH-Slu-Lm8-n1]